MRTETFGKERGKFGRKRPQMAGVSNIIEMEKLRAIKSGKMAFCTGNLFATVKREKKLAKSSTMLTSAKVTLRISL